MKTRKKKKKMKVVVDYNVVYVLKVVLRKPCRINHKINEMVEQRRELLLFFITYVFISILKQGKSVHGIFCTPVYWHKGNE